MIRTIPAGYEQRRLPQGEVVAHHRVVDAVIAAMGGGSLYEWAASHPERRELQGRIAAYAVPLPDQSARIVVRHAHHGGMLAPLLRDLFTPPTRASLELSISTLLRQSGVPTPPVAAYAIYPAGPLLRRSDIATVELPGEDLGAALARGPAPDVRQGLIGVVAELLGALTQAGAWHPDLNVKNIFLVSDGDDPPQGAVLDVDRVTFVPPGDPNLREANFRRLQRSNERWRARHQVGFTDDELRDLHDRLTKEEAVQAAHRALALEEYMP